MYTCVYTYVHKYIHMYAHIFRFCESKQMFTHQSAKEGLSETRVIGFGRIQEAPAFLETPICYSIPIPMYNSYI